MSIKSSVGNFTRTVEDTLSSSIAVLKTQMQNIVGTVGVSLTNIWAGGFTGMSEQGMADLKTNLNTYCQEIEDLIAGFDQTGDITSALKGEVQSAAYDFISAIKTLLQAYVSRMRQEILEVDEAYKNFVASGQSISSDVRDAASDIRSNAENIRLD